MTRLATILITAGLAWSISFPPSYRNTALVVVTTCRAPHHYFAYDAVPIADDVTASVEVRRQPTPHGAACRLTVTLMQAVDDDPEHDRIADEASYDY